MKIRYRLNPKGEEAAHAGLPIDLAQAWETKGVKAAVWLALRDDPSATGCDGHWVGITRRNRSGSTVLDWTVRFRCYRGNEALTEEITGSLKPEDWEAAEAEIEAAHDRLAEAAADAYLTAARSG